jgi:2-polyprenyl-3-methyl-5-hydroxy-6-metoxy-1,4-benzoquinol methylase
MWLIQKTRNVVRGIRQRWGSRETKQRIWDREYAGGRWDHCEHTPDAYIYEYVYRFCHNGNVLDLGCGSGNTGNEMDTARYGRYTGIDVSHVAVRKAAARSAATGRTEKNRYVQGDILDFVLPKEAYDVILFRESIYYVPLPKIKALLDRCAGYLAAQGVIIVDVDVGGTKPERARKILEIIETGFRVLEKESPKKAGDFVAVFKPA